MLAELIDVASTLQKVAGLAVPYFADWCAVDLLDQDGSCGVWRSPTWTRPRSNWPRTTPPLPARPGGPLGVWNILRTGKAELVPEIPDVLLVETAKDQDLLRILRELGLGRTWAYRSPCGQARSASSPSSPLSRDGTSGRTTCTSPRTWATVRPSPSRTPGSTANLRRRPPQGRVPGDAGPRTSQPAGPYPQRPADHEDAGADGEAVEQARQMTERQVRHMVRLVDDLLDVSRIMRGKIELRKEPVDTGHADRPGDRNGPADDRRPRPALAPLPSRPNRCGWKPTRHGWPRSSGTC